MSRYAKLVAVFLAAIVSISVYTIVDRFKITTDLGAFLPEGESQIETLMVDLLDKGATSNLVFVGIKGDDIAILAAANKRLVERLTKSDYFTAIHNSPEGLTERQQTLIKQYRYLLSNRLASESMTVDGLRDALKQRMQGLTSPLAPVEKKFIRFDPTGEMLNIFSQIAMQNKDKSSAPRLVDGVWVSRSGLRSLMILEINATAFDLDGLSDAINLLHNEIDQLKLDNINLDFDITGPAEFSVYSRDVIREDVRMLSLLAIFGVGVFLFLALRSLPLLLQIFVPLMCGIVSAIASVLLVFGQINGITLAFGVTLIGVAIDYPIHFFTHLGHNGRDHSQESLNLIWPTLRLGVLSTVIAYGALMFSNLSGLRQLGLFTLTGLLVAAMVTRWVLPIIMPKQIDLGEGLSGLHAFLERLAHPAYKARWFMLAVTIAGLTYLAFTEATIADYNTRSLSPISKQQTLLDSEIRGELGHWSGGKLLLVSGNNDQQVLQRLEQIEPFLEKLIAKEFISDYTSVTRFLPSVQVQQMRQAVLPERRQLEKNMAQVLPEFPFKAKLFNQFIDDVEQSKQLPALTLDLLTQYDLNDKVGALLHEKEGIWYAPVLLYQGLDAKLIRAELVKNIDEEDWLSVIELRTESNRIMKNALHNMVKLISIGGLCIYLLLVISFKDMIRPFKILLPTLMAVGLTVFILVVSGVSINVFHIVSLLLVVGIGLDYSLFFHRLTDHEEEWSSTFRALWMCCFSTVLVFGILILSKTPPLHAVGMTVSIGAILCLSLGAMFASRSLRHPD